MHYRTKQPHGDLEKAFADEWERENKKSPGLNYGHGLLQDLMFCGSTYFARAVHWVTPVERWIAATVIQWLGTNCGFCFLCTCLEKCGYVVMKREDLDFMTGEADRRKRQAISDRIARGSNPYAKRKLAA